MIEVTCGMKAIDLPYMLQVYDVTEEMFDELVDEDTKAELIDGVMIVHSPASMEHDNIGGFVRGLMSFYSDAKGLGVVLGPDSLIHLAPGRKCAPDVFFIRQARVPTPLPKEFEGVPDLVLGVLSPSNRRYDLRDKRLIYREAGVEEVWFIDAELRRIIVDRRRAGSYTEEIVTEGKVFSAVLQGFWVNASWLWATPLPNRFMCLEEILRGT
ncbi:MAG: Uma2 family endonuclease [Candidatus Entotheonellia bacterium]